VGPTRKHE
jgi:hypothetical protein